MEIPFKKINDGIIINVKVVPRSSKKGITGIVDNLLKIKLTAPPVGNAANEQMIEVLSEETGIKKSSIMIIRGTTSRKKVIKIKGISKI